MVTEDVVPSNMGKAEAQSLKAHLHNAEIQCLRSNGASALRRPAPAVPFQDGSSSKQVF